jgi:hypothetical protein
MSHFALFGLIWFLVFLVTAFFLHSEILKSLFIKRLLYCISYGGLMSALGVFAFLALHPEGANATEMYLHFSPFTPRAQMPPKNSMQTGATKSPVDFLC